LPGHSAYLIYQVIKNRVIQKVIPSLGRKSNAQKYFSIAMIFVSLLAAIGLGIYVDGYIIHPPQQFTGVCPTPAHISGNGGHCTNTEIDTTTVGTVIKTTTVQVPAGTILIPNATATVTKTVTK
jgi:hypothetical protein